MKQQTVVFLLVVVSLIASTAALGLRPREVSSHGHEGLQRMNEVRSEIHDRQQQALERVVNHFAPELFCHIVKSNRTIPHFKYLFKALSTSTFSTMLTGTCPPTIKATVFGPTDDAFEEKASELKFASVDAMLAVKPAVNKFLSYHTILGKQLTTHDVPLNGKVEVMTVAGEPIVLTKRTMLVHKKLVDIVFVQDATGHEAQVLLPNLRVGEVVLHAINKVLQPKKLL